MIVPHVMKRVIVMAQPNVLTVQVMIVLVTRAGKVMATVMTVQGVLISIVLTLTVMTVTVVLS